MVYPCLITFYILLMFCQQIIAWYYIIFNSFFFRNLKLSTCRIKRSVFLYDLVICRKNHDKLFRIHFSVVSSLFCFSDDSIFDYLGRRLSLKTSVAEDTEVFRFILSCKYVVSVLDSIKW
jgi:hypothetical protein